MIVYLSIFVPQEHSNEKWSFLFSLSMSTMCLDFCFFGFSSSHGWMWELEHKEGWVRKSWSFWTVVLEKTLESFLDCKEAKPVNPRKSTLNIHWKDWCWSWSSNTLSTWCEKPTHWKRPWCWERLKAGGEGDNRGWDGLATSLTQWTRVWANSRRQWRTGKPVMLHVVHGVTKSHTWLSKWPTTICLTFFVIIGQQKIKEFCITKTTI